MYSYVHSIWSFFLEVADTNILGDQIFSFATQVSNYFSIEKTANTYVYCCRCFNTNLKIRKIFFDKTVNTLVFRQHTLLFHKYILSWRNPHTNKFWEKNQTVPEKRPLILLFFTSYCLANLLNSIFFDFQASNLNVNNYNSLYTIPLWYSKIDFKDNCVYVDD